MPRPIQLRLRADPSPDRRAGADRWAVADHAPDLPRRRSAWPPGREPPPGLRRAGCPSAAPSPESKQTLSPGCCVSAGCSRAAGAGAGLMLAVGSTVGGPGEAPDAPMEQTAGSIPNGGAGVSLITPSLWSSAVGGPSEYRCSGPPCTVL
jgi:hypothetical protein